MSAALASQSQTNLVRILGRLGAARHINPSSRQNIVHHFLLQGCAVGVP
jgi:hypothetical protein